MRSVCVRFVFRVRSVCTLGSFATCLNLPRSWYDAGKHTWCSSTTSQTDKCITTRYLCVHNQKADDDVHFHTVCTTCTTAVLDKSTLELKWNEFRNDLSVDHLIIIPLFLMNYCFSLAEDTPARMAGISASILASSKGVFCSLNCGYLLWK